MQMNGFAQRDDRAGETSVHRERARIKDAILHELPHGDRLLLVLWHAERMNPAEIGAVLGMEESEVVASHERIVAMLNTALAPARASA